MRIVIIIHYNDDNISKWSANVYQRYEFLSSKRYPSLYGLGVNNIEHVFTVYHIQSEIVIKNFSFTVVM